MTDQKPVRKVIFAYEPNEPYMDDLVEALAVSLGVYGYKLIGRVLDDAVIFPDGWEEFYAFICFGSWDYLSSRVPAGVKRVLVMYNQPHSVKRPYPFRVKFVEVPAETGTIVWVLDHLS